MVNTEQIFTNTESRMSDSLLRDLYLINQRFVNYIRSKEQRKTFLSMSIPPSPDKSIKSLASKVVDGVSNDLKASKSLAIESTQTVANGFLCLYCLSPSGRGFLNTIKMHQSFVILLQQFKQFDAAVYQLKIMYQVLKCSLSNTPLYLDATIGDEYLTMGLPFVADIELEGIVKAIIAFHFLCLQTLLKMISVNFDALLNGENSLVHLELLKGLPNFFLSSSDFVKWIKLQSDPLANTKHYANIITILRGVHSFCVRLQKAGTSGFIDAKANIELKLIEYMWLKDGKHSMNTKGFIIEKLSTVEPFYRDLKSLSNAPLIPEIDSLFQEPPAKRILLDQIYLLATDTQITDLITAMTREPTRDFCTEPNVIKSLKKWSLVSEPSLIFRLSYSLLSFVLKNHLLMERLSSQNIEVIDMMLSSLRHLNESLIEPSIVVDALMECHTLLVYFKEYAEIMKLSTLLYNYGGKLDSLTSKVKCITLSAEYGLDCIESSSTQHKTIGKSLEAKVERSTRLLVETGRPEAALPLIMRFYMNALQDSQFPCHIRKLSPAIANSFWKCIETVDTLCFSPTEMDEPQQAEIFVNLLLGLGGDESNQVEIAAQLIHLLPKNNTCLRLSCLFHYYLSGYPPEHVEVPLPEPTRSVELLLTAGIKLAKVIATGFDTTGLEISLLYLKQCLSSNDKSRDWSEYKENIVNLFILFLKQNFLFDQEYKLINTYLFENNEGSPRFTFQVLLEKARVCIELEDRDEVLLALELAGKLAKKSVPDLPAAGAIKSKDLLEWKILQLKYHVMVDETKTAVQKQDHLRKFVMSKPEFSLTYRQKDHSIEDRLQNLLSVAKFQLFSSDLNRRQAFMVESLQNSKISLKLLQSVIKKIGQYPIEQAQQVMWEAVDIFQRSILNVVSISKHLGVSRDIVNLLNEFRKVNESLSFPLVKGLNHFKLSDNLLVLGDVEESEVEFVRGKSLMKLFPDERLKTAFSNSQFLHSVSEQSALRYVNKELNPESLMNAVMLNPATDLGDHLLFGFEKLKVAFDLLMKEEISRVNCRIQDLPVASLLLKHGAGNPTITENSILEKLERHKEQLISFVSANLRTPYAILKLAAKQLYQIEYYLSIFKPERRKDEHEIYFYTDLIRSLPTQHDKFIRDTTPRSAEDILPEFVPSLHLLDRVSARSFYSDLKSFLPVNWCIAHLEFTEDNQALMMTKISAHSDYTPITLRLPVSRFKSRSSAPSPSLEDAQNSLKVVIEQSTASMQKEVVSNIHTTEQRKTWWRARFALDLKLNELVDTIENHWLGGFAGFFEPFEHNSNQRFKAEVEEFVKSAILNDTDSACDINIDAMLAGLILVCGHKALMSDKDHRGKIKDIIHYMVDTMINSGSLGVPEDLDLNILVDKFTDLLIGLKSELSLTIQYEHTVLVTDLSCSEFPWESLNCFRNNSITRMPSTHSLLEALKSNENMKISKPDRPLMAKYLVNPEGDLVKTENLFRDILRSQDSWSGIIGNKPPEMESFLAGILSHDLFIYIGHGGCDQYLKPISLFRATDKNRRIPPSLLMGCSSGAISRNGALEPDGNVFNYLVCGSPMVVVNLWDVTDKDIDKFSLELFRRSSLAHTGEGQDFAKSVRDSRGSCFLKYLNGSAPVIYGLPLKI